jgi:formylglycine-generating enzyme required for sulfatase activity
MWAALLSAVPVGAQSSPYAAMARVPAGTFMMGSNDGFDDEKPLQRVTISKAFSIGKYEVTQKEWWDVMGTTIAQQWTAAGNSGSPTRGVGDNYPMYCVSWYEAVEYCNKRSVKEGLRPAYTVNGNEVTWNRKANGYRLPTDAEWEYAARSGGIDTYTYAGSNNAGSVAWYEDNSGWSTQPVGKKQANSLGIHDMSGNVWEWCWDWYSSGSYGRGSVTDPTGAASGTNRVRRGGSWDYHLRYVRCAYRHYDPPANRGSYLGFRVARP